MAKIEIQSPLDQPNGKFRLIDELRTNLQSKKYNQFRFIAAFVREGPLQRLSSEITKWNNRGNSIRAIIGIDQNITSEEALLFTINNFTQTYILHNNSGIKSTFHPKIYVFDSSSESVAYIGSNNLTVGGTETNFESLVKLTLNKSDDKILINRVNKIWEETLKKARNLDQSLLNELIVSGLISNEKIQRKSNRSNIKLKKNKNVLTGFNSVNVKPPSPLPRNLTGKLPSSSKSLGKKKSTIKVGSIPTLPATSLLIQIIPHHNAEVLLSKTAIKQNPNFFGYPFTGFTKPKSSKNPPYPQRDPKPKTNFIVYDNNDLQIANIENFELTTVDYVRRGEVRITLPQEVHNNNVPPYSIMRISDDSIELNIDYEIEIFFPNCTYYNLYLKSCNQQMPSGGLNQPRKFGWL